MRRGSIFGGFCLSAAMFTTAAMAEGGLNLPLEGSFGQNGFDRYVPPITNPVFNETPFITTEAKPFYAYHDIPDDFVTDGGSVSVVGLQLRLALTERLGFIATTDGYSWLDFDQGLSDTDGWNDVAFGLKYVAINKPEDGEIVTVGLRYTAPIGNIDIDELSVDLNGVGGGYINPFITSAKLWDKTQIQGMMGAQIALSDDATSTFVAAGHIDYEIAPGLFPSLEYNLFVPLKGGNQIDGQGFLDRTSGVDILDPGSSEPETVLTIGGGIRYRATDNVLLGFGGDYNTLQDASHLYGWRLLFDMVLHY